MAFMSGDYTETEQIKQMMRSLSSLSFLFSYGATANALAQTHTPPSNVRVRHECILNPTGRQIDPTLYALPSLPSDYGGLCSFHPLLFPTEDGGRLNVARGLKGSHETKKGNGRAHRSMHTGFALPPTDRQYIRLSFPPRRRSTQSQHNETLSMRAS